MITTAQDPRLLEWAGQILGVKFAPEQSAWVTKLNADYTPAAVVVYTRFSPHNCEMSVASDGRALWASREFLRVVYRYPFEQLHLARITAVIEEDNERSLTLCAKLGHTQEGRLKRWFGTKDGIVMRMLADECKWIGVSR